MFLVVRSWLKYYRDETLGQACLGHLDRDVGFLYISMKAVWQIRPKMYVH
jgi:hypothetical protein